MKQEEKKKYFSPGLNWGPPACEAGVITTRPLKLICSAQELSGALGSCGGVAASNSVYKPALGILAVDVERRPMRMSGTRKNANKENTLDLLAAAIRDGEPTLDIRAHRYDFQAGLRSFTAISNRQTTKV